MALPKTGLLSIIINKILLEHSHTHLYTYCLCLLSSYTIRVEQLRQMPHIPQSLKYTLSGPLQKKFTNPWFRLCKKKPV